MEKEIERPPFRSESWTEYVLSLLKENEKENGYPKCEGLRRVCEDLIGPIVSREIEVIQAPKSLTDYAVVKVKIGVLVVNDETHYAYENNIVYEEDVAECSPGNTPAPFSRHQTATATTRAEGRALRKLMRLYGVHTYEEALSSEISTDNVNTKVSSNNVYNDEDDLKVISDAQVNVIDTLCKRCDVDVMSVVNLVKKTEDIMTLNKGEARQVISILTKIQETGERPKEIFSKHYNANWRSK